MTKEKELLDMKLAETEKVMNELIVHTEEGRKMVNDLKEKLHSDGLLHKKNMEQIEAKLQKTKAAKATERAVWPIIQ